MRYNMRFLVVGLAGSLIGCATGSPTGAALALIGVDTVAPAQVTAGEVVEVTCLLLDENNLPHAQGPDDFAEITFSPAGSVTLDSQKRWVATRSGKVDVGCAFSSRSLIDATPASITIVPGAARLVETQLSTTQVTAGGQVTATCAVYDAFGNLIADAKPTVSSVPSAAGNTQMTGTLKGTYTTAGVYNVSCTLAGTIGPGVPLEVLPSLPAKLVISKVPNQPIYEVDAVVEVPWVVTDKYDNVVGDAPIDSVSQPAASTIFGESRYRYLNEGFYKVNVKVTGPTEGNLPLTASVDIEVGGLGPTIKCGTPSNGAMVNKAPGSTVTVTGTITDPNGLGTVKINNVKATVTNGAFSANVTSRFGINTVNIVATDKHGAENTRSCFFLLADSWVKQGSQLNDGVGLKMTQTAIDDSVRNGTINSLADLLYTMLNSTALRNTINSQLLAANPLKAESCDYDTFLGCAYSSGVRFNSLSLPSTNTVTLNLITNGIAATGRINDLGLNLRVYGDVSVIPYDTTGWVDISYIQVSLTLDTALVNGTPHITVRANSVTSTVGTVSTNFNGVDGWIINNIVVPLAQGTLKDLINTKIKAYIQTNFSQTLDGLVSGLDVSTFGQTFNVPRLDGGSPIGLSFGVGFSTLSTSTSRINFGVGTTLNGPSNNALTSLGAPLPPGTVLIDPTINSPQSVSVGVHIGVINQALHALWKGGMFDVTLGGASLGAPNGAGVKVAAALPPVASLTTDGKIELALGAMGVDLTYPGIFGGTDSTGKAIPPLHIDLGARATATVTLVGNTLKFAGFAINELTLSTPDVPLSGSTQTKVESLVLNLVGKIVDKALNQALPAVPIPTFTLPSSVAQYGLPAGKQLGITSPSISLTTLHFLLRGSLGIW